MHGIDPSISPLLCDSIRLRYLNLEERKEALPLQMTMSHWKWTRLLSGNLNMEKSLASAVPVIRS